MSTFCEFTKLYLLAVSALIAVKSSLIDDMKNLNNWKKGDPCTSNWTGVICFPAARDDGYFHIREM